MFVLSIIADLVQILPDDFSKPSIQAIEDNINAKYANKVLQKVGLCICLYDILSASEGLVGPGQGAANVNVEFRMVVFRPFKGEVIMARIKSSTPAGIHLRTDFFDDIFVAAEHLPPDCEYKHTSQVWVWQVDDTELFYDSNEMVRVEVVGEEWNDEIPTADQLELGVELPVPYKILGSMAKEGLGCCIWWEDTGDQE